MEMQHLTDKNGEIISVVIPVDMWDQILKKHRDIESIVDGTDTENYDDNPKTLGEFLTSENVIYRTMGLVRFIGQFEKWDLKVLKELATELQRKMLSKEYQPNTNNFIMTILRLTLMQIDTIHSHPN